MRLDRDAALTLEVHRIESLLLELTRGYRMRKLEDAVGKRRLPVVDVRDDAEVAYVVESHFVSVALILSQPLL